MEILLPLENSQTVQAVRKEDTLEGKGMKQTACAVSFQVDSSWIKHLVVGQGTDQGRNSGRRENRALQRDKPVWLVLFHKTQNRLFKRFRIQIRSWTIIPKVLSPIITKAHESEKFSSSTEGGRRPLLSKNVTSVGAHDRAPSAQVSHWWAAPARPPAGHPPPTENSD